VTWHSRRDVRVDTVPDPKIVDPTDVIVRITSSGLGPAWDRLKITASTNADRHRWAPPV
jgi:hypothetical protein